MENPLHWNAVMKAINRFHWDHKTINDTIVFNLINCLDAEALLTSKPSNLHLVIKQALISKIKDRSASYQSLGAYLYFKLKDIGAVE